MTKCQIHLDFEWRKNQSRSWGCESLLFSLQIDTNEWCFCSDYQKQAIWEDSFCKSTWHFRIACTLILKWKKNEYFFGFKVSIIHSIVFWISWNIWMEAFISISVTYQKRYFINWESLCKSCIHKSTMVAKRVERLRH